MAGGIWTSQNKMRPGAYINFETESQSGINIGDRGIVALAMPLSWGGENAIIEVTANDLLTGKSLAKTGLMYSDANALLLNLALQNASILKLYNTNINGVRASKTLTAGEGATGLTITAKYPGTFGNKIAILITETNGIFTVETYADGYFVDRQRVASAAELVANDYVTFTTEGVTLSPTVSTLLTGGTDGTAGTLSAFFDVLTNTRFNTVAITSTQAADITSAITFATSMRENEGKYIQVVVANANDADTEGVINVVNGVKYEDGTEVTAAQFTAWVAGATAGARFNESLTGKVVQNATSIIGMLSNDQIIEALKVGKFVLSLNQDGSVKVEKDINSLHTFTSTKNYTFSKNRIIRELDEIGSSIERVWETTYLGKISNNEAGRTLFKSSIIDYLTELQNQGAIDEFDAETVTVEAGTDVDSVLASIAIKPVDSMEFLYMTVNVTQNS